MPPEKEKTLLLVEDDMITLLAEKEGLERLGSQVIISGSGREAIETVEEHPGIDIILMDIDLGEGMDGTVAALHILEKEISPWFFSSHTERDIVEKTEKITSCGYVVKDSGFTVLDASIKMAFRVPSLFSACPYFSKV